VPRRLTAIHLLLLSAFALADSADADELPPIECVETLRKSRAERASGKGAEAQRRLEKAVETAGCELPALAELLSLARNGEYPEQRALAFRPRLQNLLRDPAQPLPAGTLSYLTSFHAPANEDSELLAALEQRLSLSPAPAEPPASADLVELLSVVERLQERLARLTEARATLERLLTLDLRDLWQWRALEVDFRLERWDEVAKRIETMLAEPDPPYWLRQQYIVALARLGRYDDVRREVTRIQEELEGGGEVDAALQSSLLTVAWAARDAGADAEAEPLFRLVLRLNPENAEAQGALLHLYGSAEERAAYRASLAEQRAKETNPQALFEVGSRLLASGDTAGALDLLARAAPALERSSYQEPAWYNLGLAAFKLEHWAQAAEAFQHAAALNPERAETAYQLGIALFRAERCADALAPLRRAIALTPGKGELHYFLASCYQATGAAADAARELELYRQYKAQKSGA